MNDGRKCLDYDTEIFENEIFLDSSLAPWRIPLPTSSSRGSRFNDSGATASTNLLLSRRRQNSIPYRDFPDTELTDFQDYDIASTDLLFGNMTLESPKRLQTKISKNHSSDCKELGANASVSENVMFRRPQGVAGWFFGFMYEETYSDSFDYDDEEDQNVAASAWNSLNMALFVGYALTSIAATAPILLIPAISQDLQSSQGNEASAFTSRAASSAVFGIACGKFLNGPVADVYGARRTSVTYSMLLSAALVGLSVSQTPAGFTAACFYVEFFQSVQWPCIILILATHYRPPNHTQYENGIYVTSIASRLGALAGIPVFSALLLQYHWRVVCLIGAWVAMLGSSVMYLFSMDSPSTVNEPQNPLHHHLLHQLDTLDACKAPKRCLVVVLRVIQSMIINNILPSFRHVLLSGTFWIVALAHTGSAMIRTSERILGSYYHDTSLGNLSKHDASGLSVTMSLGTILGLTIAGRMYSQRKDRQKKRLVSRLYMITIAACYCLAFLAVPRLRYAVDAPDLILFFQLVASLSMGFGMAVMYSFIPGLVGSAFTTHKGLYFAYTDGVANGIASLVWTFVAGAVENGNPDGGGWAYGWAAVALLIVLCAILMVEFLEHYFFVRTSGRSKGTYETILFA